MTPQRIVSVVPSQTELLFDLGLNDEVVGITKFCIHPADKVRTKTVVGGTKTLHLDQIHALKPDLILANKEENTRDQIEELQRHYPVHITDMVTLPDALTMIRTVGRLVGKELQAEQMARQISATLPVGVVPGSGCESNVQRYRANSQDCADNLTQGYRSQDYSTRNHCQGPSGPLAGLRVAYLIWRKPYMVAAGDTFIDAMLGAAGFRNAFAGQTRYPEASPDDLRAAEPDLIFLSSEPYPFAEKHIAELLAVCPSARVLIVDGEVFSWYGSRLLRAADYFRNLQDEIARIQ